MPSKHFSSIYPCILSKIHETLPTEYDQHHLKFFDSTLAAKITINKILTDILFCEKNENKPKDFIKKFHQLTNGKYLVSINWIKKKVKGLFLLKDKKIYLACKIDHGLRSCKENYIGESKRNMATRWGEHNPTHDSDPEKHLNKTLT